MKQRFSLCSNCTQHQISIVKLISNFGSAETVHVSQYTYKSYHYSLYCIYTLEMYLRNRTHKLHRNRTCPNWYKDNSNKLEHYITNKGLNTKAYSAINKLSDSISEWMSSDKNFKILLKHFMTSQRWHFRNCSIFIFQRN